MSAVILTGDCRDVLAKLPPNSIDACVTDPPYGLEFMGKDWDGIGRRHNNHLDPSMQITHDASDRPRAKDNPWQKERSGYGAPKRPKRCRICGRLEFAGGGRNGSGSSCGCAVPDWDTRTAEYARSMQAWHETWAREVYRVLKPGAHLLAFSGTRTSHRMICAIEDAGFEIRDCLMWIYGSGFPKSLDVSKALDKAAGAEREVVGPHPLANRKPNPHSDSGRGSLGGGRLGALPDETAPATDLGRQWEGWGTALKPAYEPVLLCAKPVTVEQHFAIIVEWLTTIMQETVQCSPWYALDAETSFNAIRARSNEAASTVLDNARIKSLASIGAVSSATLSSIFRDPASNEPTKTKASSALSHVRQPGSADEPSELITAFGEVDDISTKLMAMSMSVMTDGMSESIASSWLSISDAILHRASTFTIETAIRLTTALRIWNSSTREIITDGTGGLSPNYEPIVLARKPLIGSVAANVTAYGTGGLNVDGCRIEGEPWQEHDATGLASVKFFTDGETKVIHKSPHSLGRWPANVLLGHHPDCREVGTKRVKGLRPWEYKSSGENQSLSIGDGAGDWVKGTERKGYADADGYETIPAWDCHPDCAVALLDAMSGERKSGERPANRANIGYHGNGNGTSESRIVLDTGGASRFFYTSKSSRAERNKGLAGMPESHSVGPMAGRGQPGLKCRICGRWKVSGNPCTCDEPDWEQSAFERPAIANHHPTVKPVDLMQWLVRLVTPRGGVVLDPFCGSGSTGIAADREGFDFIGIEQDPDYAEIARRRFVGDCPLFATIVEEDTPSRSLIDYD